MIDAKHPREAKRSWTLSALGCSVALLAANGSSVWGQNPVTRVMLNEATAPAGQTSSTANARGPGSPASQANGTVKKGPAPNGLPEAKLETNILPRDSTPAVKLP